MSSSYVPLSDRIESQMKFIETNFHRLLLFFLHHSENWVSQNCFFPFSIFEMYVNAPMMWNFGYGNRVHCPRRRPSFKIFLFEWKWFWLVHEDLSIGFGRTILLRNRNIAGKKGINLLRMKRSWNWKKAACYPDGESGKYVLQRNDIGYSTAKGAATKNDKLCNVKESKH